MSSATVELVSGNPLLGTWSLKSYVMTTGSGERATPFGEQPSGYLVYSPDGRMQVIGTSGGRMMPRSLAVTHEERLALHDTMFAYAGTYSLQAGKVIHHVDISWNQLWTGTDQARFYEVQGNILTLTARLTDPTTGAESHYAVVWEKVTGPGGVLPLRS
jgi:hypothetical protein